ncbi:glycoside hydrolase family 73 protein [Secundilactobacillus sp. HBUAS58055]|uniref:glycoside hydrolase family 73 protein n=1 Tax=Secundilactobacillus angelensis TaxID=2722706 RepID=UPI001E56B3A1|nr:glycoside hydrolase family 73 protein [Secundilactobacillus angelensis]MCH5462319.1 glycoside hydrolase family 73 protein [Secundilactobacillus angelensis]
MAKKKRRSKKNNSQGVATLIFLLALFVIGGGLGVRYVMNNIESRQEQANKPTNSETPEQRQQRKFIDSVAKPAINVYKDNHQVLPSIVVAQAIIESNWGHSQLYQQANNPFGIKGSYNGRTKSFPTTEYINGKEERINANFRVYPNLEASILDHDAVVAQQFLPAHVTNYRTAAKLLQQNGYATDPTYAKKLINVINTYSLNRFDGY